MALTMALVMVLVLATVLTMALAVALPRYNTWSRTPRPSARSRKHTPKDCKKCVRFGEGLAKPLNKLTTIWPNIQKLFKMFGR
jgi:hypothetical protein